MDLQSVAYVAAGAGIVLTIVQFSMKTMIPLRLVGIATNVVFLLYSMLAVVWPTLILNCIILPLNVYRLREMRQLIRKTQEASKTGFDLLALEPFMSRRSTQAGETLFRKGDEADSMYLVVSGRFLLPETGIELKPGNFVGELGLFAPDRLRTQSLVSLEAGDIRVLPYERFEVLYFQNPQFGLAFLRLTTGRLFENIARLEAELAARPPARPVAGEAASA